MPAVMVLGFEGAVSSNVPRGVAFPAEARRGKAVVVLQFGHLKWPAGAREERGSVPWSGSHRMGGHVNITLTDSSIKMCRFHPPPDPS